MNTLIYPFTVVHESTRSRTTAVDPYASEAQSAALLRSGAEYRRDRMNASDMITTDEAAELAGTSRVTINAWLKAGRCIGVANFRRGFKLPKWQFEPTTFPLIHPIAQALGTTDGWVLLAFLESPQPALDGQTARTALERGTPGERILELATAEGH